MDWLTFISNLVSALAWPVAAVTGFLMLRKPVLALLPGITKVKISEFEAEFAKDLQQIKRHTEADSDIQAVQDKALRSRGQELSDMATFGPKAAVLEAWIELETAAKSLLMAHGQSLDYNSRAPYLLIGQMLQDHDLLANKDLTIYHELRDLRNKVAHWDHFQITTEQSREYVKLALQLAGKLVPRGAHQAKAVRTG
ncbi:hypothetical protein [Aestuariispira insulae]|uniref:DUF4145 domain-containing protein n=1 Tax=Aestuariispira insulae TaxID=1461337 RepID=A0A3D9HQ60_9PROT|nr:hypothetical protein [Aestuariispira insulae]RED51589.1 hypothetical protein DFP90_103392 [Aestuariispira insulae]